MVAPVGAPLPRSFASEDKKAAYPGPVKEYGR